jgi:hypothetical protein
MMRRSSRDQVAKQLKNGVTLQDLRDMAYRLDHAHEVDLADELNAHADRCEATIREKGWDPETAVITGGRR